MNRTCGVIGGDRVIERSRGMRIVNAEGGALLIRAASGSDRVPTGR